MNKLLASFFFFLLSITFLHAQTCTMKVSTQHVCLGNTVNFSVQSVSGGGTITGYQWDFGNGATNNQSAVIYQYPASGAFIPKLTITFSGGATCVTTGDTIVVFGLPKAQFNFLTDTTQCFKGNLICIKDLSSVDVGNAPLKDGNFNWDDGTKILFNGVFGQTLCHTYIDPFGTLATPVLEVSDSNGCVSRVEKTNSVKVFSQMGAINFISTYVMQCPQTPVLFTNFTAIPKIQVKKFKWDFGDGAIDTTRWDTLTHVYTAGGTFNITLFVTDINNCTDSFVLPNGAANANLDPTIYIDSIRSCYRDNKVKFGTHNPGAEIQWALYDFSSKALIDTSPSLNSPYTFQNCGQYQLRLYVNYPGTTCQSYTDTIIHVYGPNAIAQNDTAKILNQLQCEIHDTVRFRTPVPYLNCHSENPGMKRLWDFGDIYTGAPYLAEACTTDTKNNINVGRNCRWSKDSMDVWHVYTPGTEGCFQVKLYMEDTIRGCWDADSAVMKLRAPSAHWDSTANPIRRGVYYKGQPCIGQAIRFMFDDVLPQCGFDTAWLLPDSACGGGWIPTRKGEVKIDYAYMSTCDSSGWVTYGAIVKNGEDANGNICYDTAWYHHLIRLLPINPRFNYVKHGTCQPYTFDLTVVDSIQDSIVKAYWSFETYSSYIRQSTFPIRLDTIVQYLSSTDSVIHGQTFTFPQQGSLYIRLTLTNTMGCQNNYGYFIDAGFQKDITVSKPTMCLGDTVTLIDYVRYYNSSTPFWEDTIRANANLEKLFWDIGDGNGFSVTGHTPRIRYPNPGIYNISLVMRDSTGCTDTAYNAATVEVLGLDAQIRATPATLYCAPFFLDFYDSTIVIGNDQITDWEWIFSDNKPRSLIQNPQHEFTSNGNFDITLAVKTFWGCTDTTTRSIFIKGPQPKFDILDSVGCAPLAVTFKNTTGVQLINWQWDFHDPNNTIFSTNRDTDIVFVYNVPGVYKIRLFGLDTVRDPSTNTLKFCNAYFPDTVTELPLRAVRVLPVANAEITGPDSICPNAVVEFIARADTNYQVFNWDMGDLTSITENFPDTVVSHTYTKRGVYQLRLVPQSSDPHICVDTAYKTIYARDIEADFDVNEDEAPVYHFTNKSTWASSYKWFIGNDLSGNPFSTDINPDKEITDTGVTTICLQAFNDQGCWDTACKTVEAKQRLIIPNVFTPGNNDGKNDAFDIDIVGWADYDIIIFNRWGTPVFKGSRDGIGNDGINWNGKEYNTGAECSSGVYFYIFKYRMKHEESERILHGTITLIRSAD